MKLTALNSPTWLLRGVIYQINPRTFSKEGTIKSITDELDFINSLGIKIVYLCPVFSEGVGTDETYWSIRQKKSETKNPKNPYKISDYFSIDPEYGTMDDLKELVDKAHLLGMKVLLDLVYMHLDSDAPILKKHPEFVQQTPNGDFIRNYYNFASLDFNCAGLREYLYCNMVYYTSVIDVDGFRCDVGDAIPVDFWIEARKRISAVKSDCILIDEGGAFSRLATAFDSAYSFDWHNALYKVFADGENATLIRAAHQNNNANLTSPYEDYDTNSRNKLPENGKLLRDIDNHDTVTDWPQRVELGAGFDGMEQIEVINFIIDGIPMIYCGNELADTAKLNMFANRFYMGKFEVTNRKNKFSPESLRRQKLLKALCSLKAESDILHFENTIWCENTQKENTISFLRKYQGKTIAFVGNSSKKELEVSVDGIKSDAKILLSNGLVKNKNNTFSFSARGYAVLEF